MKLNDNIEIFNGDCLEVMKDIKDKSVDLILCDLPYGTTSCSWDVVIPFEPLWEQYNRIIKDGKAIALFGSEPFSSNLRLSNINDYKYDWVWDKGNGSNYPLAKLQPLKFTEDIMIFYKTVSGNNTGYFLDLRKYLITEKNNTGLSSKEINNLLGNFMGSHYFTMGSQFSLPSETDYKKLQTTGFFNRKFEDLKREFEDFNIYNPQGIEPYNKVKKRGSTAQHFGASLGVENFQEFTNYPKNILDFKKKKSDKSLHPTQKPVDLLEYLIKTYTNEGGLVLDNCMGSGSTGVACINTNRRFVGIERDVDYFNISKQRLEDTIENIMGKNDQKK